MPSLLGLRGPTMTDSQGGGDRVELIAIRVNLNLELRAFAELRGTAAAIAITNACWRAPGRALHYSHTNDGPIPPICAYAAHTDGHVGRTRSAALALTH